MKNNKKTATLRLAALFLLVVHLLALTAFASGSGTILDVQVWTEGALTPATQTKGDGTLTVTSTNAPGDWWKVKVELPRVTEAGKTYDTTFVFTSNATGTIKYSANDATYLNSNEYNVQNGENTFSIRFTAGADTYNCLELGGLGEFTLTFTEISIKEVGADDSGEHTHNFVNGVCLCGQSNGFEGVNVWNEGSLTPVVREDTESTMTVTSANAAGDWWKVKVELPRSVETGKTYEATFVFTSNATGTIKYNVDGAEYLTSNEYNVQNGENTFTVRFTAGADTYNCLELGGLGEFALTFTEASVKEVSSNPETGDSLDVVLAMAAVAAVAGCAIICKKRELV